MLTMRRAVVVAIPAATTPEVASATAVAITVVANTVAAISLMEGL